MSDTQTFLITGSIWLSVILFATAIFMSINRIIKNKNMPEKYSKAGISTALAFSGFLLLSIWSLRFAVGYFSLIHADNDTQSLMGWEEWINCLFKTLRTFSMEEEYDEYIIAIKVLIGHLFPANLLKFGIVQTAMVLYASILNLLAPVVGGAIIFEILASIFPKIKLKWYYLWKRRTKYFFSELNPASLELAKSIYHEKRNEKPLLIFTDTYIDEEQEKEYERFLEAKRYGAICLRDDLAHVIKPKAGKHEYYLIDENELGNLQTLLSLTERRNICYLKEAKIYLFVQSDSYVQFEKEINKKLDGYNLESKKKNKRVLLTEDEMPTIIPIQSYRNLVRNLFVDLPLYEPLIHKKEKNKLNVAILGTGVIGTEAFMNAYWFGQMMVSQRNEGQTIISPCELSVNVVSKEPEAVFWSKIDYINSEIKDTIEISNRSDLRHHNQLLTCDGKENCNAPYCRVNYIHADVKTSGFLNGNSQELHELLGSDYFIIALGNDADNISMADKLRRLIGKKHLEEECEEAVGKVVIAYAVFNSELEATLNRQRQYQCRTKGETDIYTYAFGSLNQVYSCNNIDMSKHKLRAEGTGAAYDKTKMSQMLVWDNRDRRKNENKNYTYWADLARAMHIKYKVFSLGMIDRSVFDYPTDRVDLYEAYVEGQCDLYKRIAQTDHVDSLSEEMKKVYDHIESLKHELAWLEHRRWNAFTRTMGYQHTHEFIKNFKLNGENPKNMELKLHPCLVEARLPAMQPSCEFLQGSMKALFDQPSVQFEIDELTKEQMIGLLNQKKDCYISRADHFLRINKDELDWLDRLSYEWCKVATRENLQRIDDCLQELQYVSSNAINQPMKRKFADAWNGIGHYDYKTYDYYTYDFDKE